MTSEDERAKLEMQILKYRKFLRFIADDRFRETAKALIAELERKLRELDE